jgi:soluble lytic murein transglycosylase-like protein
LILTTAQLRALAAADARAFGLNPQIFLRQINQESGFNPRARSGAGALGIAQFMPATARGFGVNPMDPVAALRAAARMDAGNLKKYGSYQRMLSAYNSGRADAYLNPHFAGGQTYNYVRSIMGGANIPVSKFKKELMAPAGTPIAPPTSSNTGGTRAALLQWVMANG